MRFKSMKKVLAAAVSTTMVVGMSMTAFASGEITTPTTPTNPITGGGSIEAPIYSYEITRVVVPTSYGVAFNPDGLTVTVVSATNPTTTTATVASKNYGILNKSSKDKLVKVGLAVTSTEPRITFVDSQSEIDDAEKGEYKIFLNAVPADSAEVKIQTPTMPSAASAATSTQPSELAHVNMTKATSATVPLKAGNNELAFKLTKASYDLKSGQNLPLDGLDSTTSNDVKDKYEITGLATSGKGITGFTFGGDINADADWTKISAHVQITPTYTVENADSSQTVVNGTGAMVTLEAAPSIATTRYTMTSGTAIDVSINLGVGAKKASGITSVVCGGVTFAEGTHYTYDAQNSKLTFPASMVDYWLEYGPSPASVEITFNDSDSTQITLNLASN